MILIWHKTAVHKKAFILGEVVGFQINRCGKDISIVRGLERALMI